MRKNDREKILDRLGKNLRKYRKEKRLTQQELAELGNFHQHYISNIEKGERNISIETLEKIAIILDINEEDLLAD